MKITHFHLFTGILKNIFQVCVGILLALFAVSVIRSLHVGILITEEDDGELFSDKERDLITRQRLKSDDAFSKQIDISDFSDKYSVFDRECVEKFNKSLEDNLKVIDNYPGEEADLYMWKIGGNFTKPIKRRNNPVLVTAVSRNYFALFMGMIKSFHYAVVNYRQKGDRIRIIIFDLGMTRTQTRTIETSGLPCKIREFPFKEFPPHVRTKKYRAWKPILLQMLLVEFGFVWWVDTAVRFKTLNVDKAFAEAKKYGLVYKVSALKDSNSITRRTSIDTFRFLGEDVCKFKHFPEADGSSVMVYFNPISIAIVRAWAKCALDKNCIAPLNKEPVSKNECDINETYDVKCHQYDQSVFSILTRRIYHTKLLYSFNKVSEEIVEVNRSDAMDPTKCENNVCFI